MVGKKASSPSRANSPNRFSLSLTGSFISAKHNSMPAACKVSSQFGQHVGGSDVHAGDRFRRNDQPAHRRRRCGHRIQHAVMEQLGVGEEQGRIPAKQDQAGDQAGIGIALDVVVALDALGASQNRGVRAPAVPQEFDDGNHDRQADARNRAQHRHADRTDDR